MLVNKKQDRTQMGNLTLKHCEHTEELGARFVGLMEVRAKVYVERIIQKRLGI